MAVILFGGLFGPLFLMLGLSQTTAASGSLLLNLEGLATMAIAWLVFRENVEDNCYSERRLFSLEQCFCRGTDKRCASTQAGSSLRRRAWRGALITT